MPVVMKELINESWILPYIVLFKTGMEPSVGNWTAVSDQCIRIC